MKVRKIPDLDCEIWGRDLTLINVVSYLVLIHSEVPDQHKEEKDDEEINADDNQADVTLTKNDLSLVQHIFERELTRGLHEVDKGFWLVAWGTSGAKGDLVNRVTTGSPAFAILVEH